MEGPDSYAHIYSRTIFMPVNTKVALPPQPANIIQGVNQ